jgi:hypothetical protein
MRRFTILIALAGLTVFPARMFGLQEAGGDLSAPRFVRRPGPGRFVVQVLDISDHSPVAGIRVELLQSGRSALTDANGQVQFMLPPGEYDARVHDLNGPGPALRIEDVHATVTSRSTVVVQVFECGMCV